MSLYTRVAVLGCLGLLAGCAADIDELRLWMEQQHREVKATVTPLLPPKKFLPQPYEGAVGVDPFSTQKLSVAMRQEAVQPNSLLTAEINRRKEELEQFPLDSMSMIGWMYRAEEKRAYGLLRVDNQTFKVAAGNYLGQNFGRITKISETEITLREVVQDAAGEWIERTSTLQLQEKGR
jgi:type IV pilus assembly protein PilP